jgi:hypothetical protein
VSSDTITLDYYGPVAILSNNRPQRHNAASHGVCAQDKQRTVEEIPGVFSGDRKLGLRDHLLDRSSRQRGGGCAASLWQRRKVFARQRLHS